MADSTECPNCGKNVESIDESPDNVTGIGSYESSDGEVLRLNSFDIVNVRLEPCGCEFPRLTERRKFV